MNFLAHTYLSGTSDELRIGNFIGDHVKGHDYEKFPPGIKQGILMHRDIDSFTDNHPIVRQSKSYFLTRYHKFSGVIIDIFYDHFLANEWDKHSDISLHDFVGHVNEILITYSDYLPMGVRQVVPYFISDNWFETYATIDGMAKILKRMSKNTSLPYEDNHAISVLRNRYDTLKSEFNEFFPQIMDFVQKKYQVEFSKGTQII
jgi:acyl carrier protein phosphodiesterase